MYEEMKKRKRVLIEKKEILITRLSKMPSGNLICARNGNCYKWYNSDGKEKSYISKKDRKKAEKLALKKYYSLELEDVEKELQATEAYLKRYKPSKQLNDLLSPTSEIQRLLSTYLKPENQDYEAWMNEEYEKNPAFPENLIHKSISGNVLRSKSEAMIDMCLFLKKIPFRYDCALQLGDVTKYPDFTIIHPKTGKIYYWEHFGGMDDPGYKRKTSAKLQLYIANGIIPSIDLITTYETLADPLNMDTIEKIVCHYFVD